MRLLLDYVTFHTSSDATPYQVEQVLESDLCLTVGRKLGLQVSPFGVSYLPDTGGKGQTSFDYPSRWQFSGDGCRNYTPKLINLYDAFPSYCKRVDVAADFVMKKTEWRRMCSVAYQISIFDPSDDDFSWTSIPEELEEFALRQRKHIHVLSSKNDGTTIYAGVRGSPYYFRIYNKTAEDPRYISFDDDGNVVEVPSDSLLIRFEAELSWVRKCRSNRVDVYDPTPYFLSFFGRSNRLKEDLYDIWTSYFPAQWLPFDFEDIQNAVLTKELFCSISGDFTELAAIREEAAQSKACVKPVDYVVDYFGKYVPFIVASPSLWSICCDKFQRAFGVKPLISIADCGFDDIDSGQLDSFYIDSALEDIDDQAYALHDHIDRKDWPEDMI